MPAFAVAGEEEDFVGRGGRGGGVEGVDLVGEALPLGFVAAAAGGGEGGVAGVGLVYEAEVRCGL